MFGHFDNGAVLRRKALFQWLGRCSLHSIVSTMMRCSSHEWIIRKIRNQKHPLLRKASLCVFLAGPPLKKGRLGPALRHWLRAYFPGKASLADSWHEQAQSHPTIVHGVSMYEAFDLTRSRQRQIRSASSDWPSYVELVQSICSLSRYLRVFVIPCPYLTKPTIASQPDMRVSRAEAPEAYTQSIVVSG